MQRPVPQKYIYILNIHIYLHGYNNKTGESRDHGEDLSTLVRMVKFWPCDTQCLAVTSSSKSELIRQRPGKSNIISNLKQIAFKEKVKGIRAYSKEKI